LEKAEKLQSFLRLAGNLRGLSAKTGNPYWRGFHMKIISVDDDVTAYEVCNDFGIFVCEDEVRLRFGSWGEAHAFIKGCFLRPAHTRKGRIFSPAVTPV
jgi:hypothetical protein